MYDNINMDSTFFIFFYISGWNKTMSYYYIQVSGKAAGKYLTVDQEDHEVKVVEGTASNDYKWNMDPLQINQLVVRHHATNRYLEIPATGPVNAITSKNNNTTLSFSISDATQISNNVLEKPAFLVIVVNKAVTTTDAAQATKFSITAAEWLIR